MKDDTALIGLVNQLRAEMLDPASETVAHEPPVPPPSTVSSPIE